MATNVPVSQIEDSQKLSADAEIEFWEITPAGGGAIFYFKNDNTMTYLGNEYVGLPLQLTGESRTAEGNPANPQLSIGQPDIDLSIFKGLIFEGNLDNAKIERHTVLLSHALSNTNIKRTDTYRVKRVDAYSAAQIVLVLATFSVAGPSMMPFRQYIPPAFPFVRL